MGGLLKYNIFGRGFKLQVAITLTCQIAFIFFGYDQGVFSGIVRIVPEHKDSIQVSMLTRPQVTNDNWKATFGHPNSALEGIIVSIYNLGAFSGCVLTFLFGEKCGRRLCMWIGTSRSTL